MHHPLRSTLWGAAVAFVGTGVAAQEAPSVIAVNYPLAYFAERLAGDAMDVNFPVPAGVDPSFWRPSISDISTVQGADLVLLNGAGFATWIDRVSLSRSRLVNTSRGIEDQFIVTESITHSHGDGGEHSHEGLATYTWLNPTLASAQAEVIAGMMSARGLAPEADVDAALTVLKGDLEALHQEVATALSAVVGVPMIATHPRYEYLADRYDLTITSLEWDAGAAPTEEELAQLSDLMAETDAQVLIWEAEPPAEGAAATEALGLANVVFEPMAHAPSDGDFLSAFSSAAAALADAAGDLPAN
ncbi:MAG: metal ABC transporter substrate-binding protein [Rhodobacteraceae bacterium]|nr:metal ABC transporter substrate-binding protein [Paracoccaceae bacterium]